jgi:hypothetical protein
VEILKLLREAVCRKRPWSMVQRLNSPPWQCSSSQGALCQAFSGPKIAYWNGIHTLFTWFGSGWLVALYINKVCLKGTKIQRHWRHEKECDDGTESCSTTGVPKMFPAEAASLG